MNSKRLFALTAVLAAALYGTASAKALLVNHVPKSVAAHQVATESHVAPDTAMQMQVVLPMRNKDKLKTLLGALYNPQSPLYRHWLSVAEFTKRFGPTKNDYDAAMSFFNAQGLKVTHTYANRYMFQVEEIGRASCRERV